MTKVSMPKFVRSFALAAAAVLTLSLAPGQRAGAMSLVTPGATAVAKTATEGLTQVRFGGGGHGGGFHGGGFHGGGFHAFHGGGGGWHGGGFRYGGFHHLGGAHFHHRRFFYGGGYYPYYYGYYHHPRCRIIWTYHGPRRVCRWHHWHRWYHRHVFW